MHSAIVDIWPAIATGSRRHRQRNPTSFHGSVLARSTSVAELWNAFFCSGQRRKLGMGMLLVPVCYRVEIVGTQVGVTVFDRHLDRLAKTDRCFKMPAVVREARARLPLMKFREANQRIRVKGGKPPGAVEIVLPSGPVYSWLALSINPDHFISFVPPTPLVLEDGQRHSHELPVPLSFQEHVVSCA